MKSNFFYNFLLTGSNLLFPLLTFPYLSRILGADGLGICNFIISYGQNYIIIAALGIPVYGIREIAKIGNDAVKRSKVFYEILIIHLAFTVFILLVYVASILIFKEFTPYHDIALIGGSLILFNVFSVEWLFSGVNDFKYITTRSLIVRTISVICIFLFVKTKADIFTYFIILVTTVFLTASIDIYSAREFISRKIAVSFSDIKKHVKPIVFLGLYMVITSIYSVLPITLLGFFSSKAAVGYYFGANKIIRMVISLFSTLVAVMVPRINLIFETEGKEAYLALVNKALNVVVTFGIPLAFAVFLLAHPLVMLLAGKDFVNSISVIKVMSPIIIIVAFSQIFVLLVLSVHRKDQQMIMLSAIGMTVSLLINLFFIPHFAEKATAYSQFTAELLVTIVGFLLARRCIRFDFPLKKFILNILFAVPFALFTWLITKSLSSNILILILSGAVCGAYFIVYQFYFLKDRLLLELYAPYKAKFFKSGNKQLNNG